MGIFTRFKDIVSANINAMLDHAEDPEKMIKLMVREMEDTLVELKAACAQTMATRAKTVRELDAAAARMETWLDRAELAVAKGRDDLAREALVEKRRQAERVEQLEAEAVALDELVAQSREDIEALEEKLAHAKEKRRALVQRHIRANTAIRAREDMRRADGSDAMRRFEQFENRIERIEAEAELAKPPHAAGLEEEFAVLESDGDIEAELKTLKAGGAKAVREQTLQEAAEAPKEQS